eukprot:13904949-Alexandrium_andersonii.AAC.1
MRWKVPESGPPVPVAPKARPGRSNPTRGRDTVLAAGSGAGGGSSRPSPPLAPAQPARVERYRISRR